MISHSSIHGSNAGGFDLRNLWLLGPALEGVSQEDLAVVGDALLLLRRSARTVDSGRCLRGVSTAEGRFVKDDNAPAVLHDRVGCREARKTAANDNALVCREGRRHLKDAMNAKLELEAVKCQPLPFRSHRNDPNLGLVSPNRTAYLSGLVLGCIEADVCK